MSEEQRWCPACSNVVVQQDTWECPNCGTRLWTHEMLWLQYREAMRLRPKSKGAAYAEAGRLRRDLETVKGVRDELRSELAVVVDERDELRSELEVASDRIEVLELSVREGSPRMKERLEEILAWMTKLSVGSAPKKDVTLAELQGWIATIKRAVSGKDEVR